MNEGSWNSYVDFKIFLHVSTKFINVFSDIKYILVTLHNNVYKPTEIYFCCDSKILKFGQETTFILYNLNMSLILTIIYQIIGKVPEVKEKMSFYFKRLHLH